MSKKGRRKIEVEGTTYYWWIGFLSGVGKCLNIASEGKDFIVKVGTEGMYERVIQNVSDKKVVVPKELDLTRMEMWQRPKAITPKYVRQIILLYRNPSQLNNELKDAIANLKSSFLPER